jgi:uncharacterized RDD family membrane protein YckC
MFCPKCGQPTEGIARYCQSCGADLSATKTVASQTSTYAGFWKRLVALLIDSCVISLATGLIAAATMGFGWVAVFVLPWVYEAVMLSSEHQATFGKMALGIVVTDTVGRRLTFGRAAGRHFAKYLSALILFIGFLMAAFTEKKQALHDILAETLVVNKPSSVI